MRFDHQPDVAGNADRTAAGCGLAEAQRLALSIEKKLRCCGGRCGLAAVDRRRGSAFRIVADEETTAANARTLRLDHRQHKHHRHRRIGRGSPGAQYIPPGLCGARVGGGNDTGRTLRCGFLRSRFMGSAGLGAGADRQHDKGEGQDKRTDHALLSNCGMRGRLVRSSGTADSVCDRSEAIAFSESVETEHDAAAETGTLIGQRGV